MRLDPAGRPFVAGLAVTTLALVWVSPWLAAAAGAALVFTVNFFRDPERVAPDDAAALISPADGKIIRAGDGRISIFMNVFDVHVCRAPAAGTVASVRHTPGRFLAAMRDDASEQNERTEIVLERPGAAAVRFTLVAGLVARRIVCRTAAGATVVAGQRIGIIRFGSRVDVDLPPGASPTVAVGDRVVAGRSIVARLDPAPGR